MHLLKLRIKNALFKNKIEIAIQNLEDLNNKYAEYDNGKRDMQYVGNALVPYHTEKAMREMQKSTYEWAGGLNLEDSTLGPEKVVFRKGTQINSMPDQNSDVEFHTHPDRQLDNTKLLDDLAEKNKHNTKKMAEIEQLRREIRKPMDFLPSNQDLAYISGKIPNQTLLIISKENYAVLTKRDDNNDPFPKDYHVNLMDLAAKRCIRNPKNIKEAKKQIAQYQKEVKRGFHSITHLHGLDSTLQRYKRAIPFKVPSQKMRGIIHDTPPKQGKKIETYPEQYYSDVLKTQHIKHTRKAKKPIQKPIKRVKSKYGFH